MRHGGAWRENIHTTLKRKSDCLQLDLLLDFLVAITSMYITHRYMIMSTYENTVSVEIKFFRSGGISMNAFGWNCCITSVPQCIFSTFLHEKCRLIHKKIYKTLIQKLIFHEQIKCSCGKKNKYFLLECLHCPARNLYISWVRHDAPLLPATFSFFLILVCELFRAHSFSNV